MMVRTETRDLLVLEHAPWAVRFFTLLFTLICIGVAYRHYYHLGNTGWAITFVIAAALLAFGFLNALQRIRLTMDRHAGTAAVRRMTLYGTTEDVFPLGDVVKARVERKRTTASSGSGGRRVVRRAVLEMQDRQEPISLAMNYQSGTHAAVTSRIINDWLDGSATG